MSKRDALKKLFADLDALLEEHKVASRQESLTLRRSFGVTMEQQVAMIEKYVAAPYKAGQLDQYLVDECKTFRVLASQAEQFSARDPAVLAVSQRVASGALENPALLSALSRLLALIMRVIEY